MDTFFAPSEKVSEETLASEIKAVSNNPVVSGLLHSVSGLLAILNENRQIIALNNTFLEMLGIKDHEKALGLRPGEAISCVHAVDEPNGCGTTRFCSTCGAAVAIVSALEQDIPLERACALSANRGGKLVDMVLLVKAQPIRIEHKKYLLLFLQDITLQEHRASLERAFYHDVNNMLSILVQASELLMIKHPSDLAETVHQATLRLVKEVSIQRCLSESSISSYQPMWAEFSIEQIIEELRFFFANHPASKNKNVLFSENIPLIRIKTDICLLSRVLCNMIINACEATNPDGIIKVWAEQDNNLLHFCVWNSKPIPKDISKRIFQRSFSTKAESGRGIGTFSMKLFGENILGGKVSFDSSKQAGTVFKFTNYLS